MKSQTLSIDLIELDGGTQSRIAISEETVEEYAELIAESKKWPFPPLDVFHDGNRYMVADGFTRTHAAQRAKRASIPCNVHKGTSWDALLFGMGANLTHGLRPTQADKRHAVELLLDSGKRMTQQQIADITGVTRQTVSKIVAERKPQNVKSLHSERANDLEPSSSNGKPAANGKSSETTSVSVAPVSSQPASEPDPFDVDPFEDEPDEEPVPKPDSSKADPEKQFREQRSKTVKTVEALMRAFDDLQRIRKHKSHGNAIAACKNLLQTAKNWQ